MKKLLIIILLVILFQGLLVQAEELTFVPEVTELNPIITKVNNLDFGNIGKVGQGDEELPLQLKGRGEVKEYKGFYRINSIGETVIVKFGEYIFEVPSGSVIELQKIIEGGPKILLDLGPNSNGKIRSEIKAPPSGRIISNNKTIEIIPPLIMTPQNRIEYTIRFQEGDYVTFKGNEEVDFDVENSVLKFAKDKMFSYRQRDSKDDLTLESVSEIKISKNGLTGKVLVMGEENLVMGEVEGSNVFIISSSSPERKEKENIIAFSKGFDKKMIFGNVDYKDLAYDFVLKTKNAKVSILLNDINFLDGNGEVRKFFTLADSVVENLVKIENGKILFKNLFGNPTVERAFTKVDPEYKSKIFTDIFIRNEKEIVEISKLGSVYSIRDLSRENGAKFDIYDYTNYGAELRGFQEEQLGLYNYYLVSGFSKSDAVAMAYYSLDLKTSIPFLRAGFYPESIKNFIYSKISFDTIKPYLDIGVPKREIFELANRKIDPLRVKEFYDAGLNLSNIFEVIMLDMKPNDQDFILYRKALSQSKLNYFVNDGGLYARLHYYGIEPEKVNVYSKVELHGSPQDIVKVIKKISPDQVKSYLENGVYYAMDMVRLFEAGIRPEESTKYRKNNKYYIYPGIDNKDIELYAETIAAGKTAKDIAAMKILGIPPKMAKKFLEQTKDLTVLTKEAENWKEGKMKELGLKIREMYSIPFLNMLYENWKVAKRPEKDIALVIVNRNDWNGVFLLEGERYYSLFNSGYHLLLAEASTDDEAEQIIKRVKNDFGEISLALIGGHGTSEGINLGPTKDEAGEIDKSDKTFFETLNTGIKKDGKIVLQSCSTGKGIGSIAELISYSSGRIVFAPNCDTSIRGFIFDGNMKFENVEYYKGLGVTQKFEPIKTK